jgi:hypothetical protein
MSFPRFRVSARQPAIPGSASWRGSPRPPGSASWCALAPPGSASWCAAALAPPVPRLGAPSTSRFSVLVRQLFDLRSLAWDRSGSFDPGFSSRRDVRPCPSSGGQRALDVLERAALQRAHVQGNAAAHRERGDSEPVLREPTAWQRASSEAGNVRVLRGAARAPRGRERARPPKRRRDAWTFRLDALLAFRAP